GRAAAGSAGGAEPRFSSSVKGAEIILDILDEIGMKAVFFAEGRTAGKGFPGISSHCIGLHGYDHEDFSGMRTGIRFSREEKRSILRAGYEAVSDALGKPVCFRAPYMVYDPEIISMLP
ncbi:MAG: polysaccharide deacetylase family protein, partial [Candidatus Methanomethylophilaceae archaeon]|nr:polysaccharide deacetylase family protein [Candidatus Methanomethylophilaceae archaeon]